MCNKHTESFTLITLHNEEDETHTHAACAAVGYKFTTMISHEFPFVHLLARDREQEAKWLDQQIGLILMVGVHPFDGIFSCNLFGILLGRSSIIFYDILFSLGFALICVTRGDSTNFVQIITTITNAGQ